MTPGHCVLDNYDYTHTHTQNICYLLLFYYNNYCRNASQCYLCTYSACLVVPVKVRVTTIYIVTLCLHFRYNILSFCNIILYRYTHFS